MEEKKLVPEIRFKGYVGEWEEHSLGELGPVRMCKRILKAQTSKKGEVPFYKIGTFGKEPDAYISKDLFEEYKKLYSYPKKGDIIVSAAGTIGRTEVYDGKPSYFQDSNLIWIENDNKIIDNSFLAIAYSIINWATSSTTIARIYNETVRQTYTISPNSIEEQKSIGEYFKKLDGLIRETEKEIERLERLKTASLQKMFPQVDENCPQIRFNSFTEPWKGYQLGEIGEWCKGQTLSKEDIHSGGKNLCLHYGQLFSEKERIYYIETYTDKIPEKVSSGREILIPDSDVTPDGLGRCSALYIQNVILGGGINILTLKESFDPHFCALNITKCRNQIIERVTGTTVRHIHPKDLNDIMILIPSWEEQKAIGEYFRNLDNLIGEKKKKVVQLRNLKKACLSKMFVNSVKS